MSKHSISAWVPVIVALAFVAGIGSGIYMNRTTGRPAAEQKIGYIFDMIDAEYVDDVDLDSLVEKTLPSLLSNLDPHSVYIPAESLKAVNEDLDGSFSGVGISFTIQNDTVTVIEVISGGPAEKVGVMAGDRIVTIDGDPFTGPSIDNDRVMKTLRGEKGSTVTLGIRRNSSSKPLTYEVTRGDIPVTSIDASYMLADDIGYIKVNKFGRTTYNEFYQAMSALKREGATDYVIDLRGNGGGFMEMAVLMANEFLPRGSMIVYTRGRDGRNSQLNVADGSGSFQDAGVTVLLDEFSASASEIFAGAMQDNDRGVIIGRRSFGKGLVQTQTTLPDSSAIRLTISRYYTPSGRCIQKDYSNLDEYNKDILNRYDRGEAFSVDSIKLDKSLIYNTIGGRTVYGGGGIMPDIFVPNDTTGITSYFLKVRNAGLFQKWAFEYADKHREQLAACKNIDELLATLPSDYALLDDFSNFAARNGIPKQWYYIKQSSALIVDNLKALVARDALGIPGYYMIINRGDTTVDKAVETLRDGCRILDFETRPAEE
ncbi:MAG: S41 family peptidase [Muribaculaceae bacterium]|nr:S41 family peptidase [Muribaculaceae bacterium]MDE7387577.1 S41 family peptidase [Muribaculaceae bacterium]